MTYTSNLGSSDTFAPKKGGKRSVSTPEQEAARKKRLDARTTQALLAYNDALDTQISIIVAERDTTPEQRMAAFNKLSAAAASYKSMLRSRAGKGNLAEVAPMIQVLDAQLAKYKKTVAKAYADEKAAAAQRDKIQAELNKIVQMIPEKFPVYLANEAARRKAEAAQPYPVKKSNVGVMALAVAVPIIGALLLK